MDIENKKQYKEIVKNKKVNNKEEFILIDFYTTWCGPCKIQATVLEEKEEMLNQMFPALKIYSFDCDKTDGMEKIANKLGITAIPQLILYNGSIKKMESGVKRIREIIKFLNKHIPDDQKKSEDIELYLRNTT